MDTRNLALPLLAFAGGAILGRLLGLKTLVRGAMTAAAVTGMAAQPALVGAGMREMARAPARRRGATRSARKRVTQKKSKPV